MIGRSHIRELTTAGACLIAALSMLSCHDENAVSPPVLPPVPDPIRTFVETQQLPLLRDIRVDLSIPAQQLTFFHALYGQAHDCPSGCHYSSAYGVQLGEKLGWINVNDQEGGVVERLTFYNLEATDEPLFQEATWQQLQGTAEWIFWSAFLPYVAVDEDSPEGAMIRVAQRLDDYISPHIASQLLTNPRIQLYPDVLRLLACLPVFSGDAYAWARSRARDILGDDFLGCQAVRAI